MFKSLLLSLTALSVSFAHAAIAADYEIVIEEGAFYPEITYLTPGDSAIFLNRHDSSVEVAASDDSWKTGNLGTEASFVLSVSTETELNFSLASDPDISGSLSFELAPLGNVDGDSNGDYDGSGPDASN